MNISKFKLAWTFLFGGGVTGVIDYVLGVLTTALASLTDTTKAKIQAVLNTALKVLNVLNALKWLVPTKWQTAYLATINAVDYCVNSLTDLGLTKDELTAICDKTNAAVKEWQSDDDETCV